MAADNHPVGPRKKPQASSPSTSLKRHRGDDDQSDRFGHLQKLLNLPRRLGVSHRVVNVLVPEVSLQSAGVVALGGQRETAGVPQHVRVSLEA